jgi:hypothetical protein
MLPTLLYNGIKNLTAITDANGIDRLKTKAFQSDIYAFPGSARKLMLLTKVAKIDMPTTQDGSFLPPEVNCSEDLFLKKKLAPKTTLPMIRVMNTIISSKGSSSGKVDLSC